MRYQPLGSDRKDLRIPSHNYDTPRNYFVTICTKNMEEHFSVIKNNKLYLSSVGQIVQKCWREIPEHFSCVKLDEYVIMPNHVHGIVKIVDNSHEGTSHGLSLQHHGNEKAQRKYQKLPIVIGAFKSSVTRILNREFEETVFAWQRSYRETIIRNQKHLNNVRKYIRNNPAKWDEAH